MLQLHKKVHISQAYDSTAIYFISFKRDATHYNDRTVYNSHVYTTLFIGNCTYITSLPVNKLNELTKRQ